MDTDNNGVVDEGEFVQLLQTIDPTKPHKDVHLLLEKADPYNNQHITFSDAVTVLSADLLILSSKAMH